MKEGDVVIIMDSNLPRSTWLRGIVSRTCLGRDQIVRVAEVKTKFGTYRRPVSKLAVLDVYRDVEDPEDFNGGKNVDED